MSRTANDSRRKNTRRRSQRRPGRTFLIFFTIIWTLIVGGFDGAIGFLLFKQHAATSYPSVAGEIVASRVDQSTDSDGDRTYRPIVQFRYDVDGQTYTETGHRYGGFGSSDRRYAHRVVSRYPIGRSVQVFYNPEKPGDAVLETGVGSVENAIVLFLTPFNCVMLLLWLFLGGVIRQRLTGNDTGGVRIMRRAQRTILRMPRWAPLPTAVVAALGVSFVSVFVVAFSAGLDPSPMLVNAVWIATGGAAVLAFFWRLYVVNTGAKDLIIHHDTATLTMPQTFGRNDDSWCNLNQITALRVKRITHSSNSNDTYAPMLHWRDADGEDHQEQLAEWVDDDRAAQFIAWLQRTLTEFKGR